MASSYIILPALLLALFSVHLFINWNKLRKAPGPALAGFTDLWRAYQQNKGTLQRKLLDLHARHGPIVRYGVRCISINDPEVLNVVYGSRTGFITAESYNVLQGRQNGKDIQSLVSTRDEKQHGALRRSVAGAFTPTASLDYEKWVDATILEFLESVARNTTLDLSSMMLWYSMDSAGRFAFGAPVGCLAAQGDVDGSIQLIRDRFTHWGRWSSTPWLERLVYRNPIFEPAQRSPSAMVVAATARLRARAGGVAASKEEKEADASSPDLLQRFLEARTNFPQALDNPGIIGMIMSTISGAADTTASNITAILFNLLKNPDTLKKLEAELTDAGLPEIPAFVEVNKLPYLNAVIKESMRVFNSGSWPLERLVPAGGVTIAGMYFPEGTSVGCMPAAIHHNAKIFGEDHEKFCPERWLTSDREHLRQMEAAHMGFSRGRRNCIGQNIAVMQMKKVLPALLMKFKLSLVDPDASLEVDYSPAAAVLAPLYVKSEIRE
ncbi:cytochrome P450 [Xylariaceae sp. AK1471]|nr:cytochrome P450 [Xylariaceae sp. AK1471]